MNARRWIDGVLVLGTAGFAVAMLVAASDPTTDGLTLAGLLVLSAIPLLLAAIVVAVRVVRTGKGARWRTNRGRVLMLTLHPALVAAALLMTELEWPLKVRFELSRATLESVAHEVIVGHQARKSVGRIGLYRFESVDTDTAGRVQFHFGGCGWNSACDLVFHPKADCVVARSRDGARIDAQWCLEFWESSL